jgi:hypothetical protein
VEPMKNRNRVDESLVAIRSKFYILYSFILVIYDIRI